MKALGDLTLGKYETANSYLSRLAAHYGCANVPELCSDFEIPFRDAITGVDSALEKLAQLTGACLQTLRSNTPTTKNGAFSFLHETLSSAYSRRCDAFGCPDCMSADISSQPQLLPEAAVRFHRQWGIGPLLTCEIHRRPLVQVGARSSTYNKYDMALMADGIAERLPALLRDDRRRDPSDFELYALARLDGERSSGNPFDDMDLNEIFSICAAMGRVVTAAGALANQTDEERFNTFAAGFAVLTAGRDSLREFFFEHISNRLQRTPLGAAALLGEVYGLILGRRRHKFAPIASVIANAVYDVLPYAPGDHPIADVPITHRRCYFTKGAAREFGFAQKTIAHYAIAKGIARVLVPATSNRRTGTVWIDAKQAQELFGGGLDTGWKLGLKRLGFTKHGVEAVAQDGLLEPLFASGQVGKNGVSPVRMNSTRELVDRLGNHAEPLLQIPAGCKPLRRAAKTVEGFRRVHDAVLTGAIWIGQLTGGTKPYSSLIVRDSEITSLLASSEYVTIDGLSGQTGLNKMAIYEMMRDGLLPHFRVLDIKSGVTIRVFKPEVADRAAAEYIMLRQLAGGSARRAGSLKRKLSAAGVDPISVHWNGSGNEVAVYRRAEVHSLI